MLTFGCSRMFGGEIGQVPDIAVDDYPAVFGCVVFRDLLYGELLFFAHDSSDSIKWTGEKVIAEKRPTT